MTMGRQAGVLMPVFSLPGPWGIGSLSAHAERFIHDLAAAGQSLWQILPTGPTGYGDSPYQSFSTFAGNPYFIDLDDLVAQGLLSAADLAALNWGTSPDRIDYGAIYHSRNQALRWAFEHSTGFETDPDFQSFAAGAAHWLDDYASYMTIKASQDHHPWTQWPTGLRHRDPQALGAVAERYPAEMAYHRWTQWVFATHWARIRRCAHQAGVRIIGDIPIYVALDSADAWAHTELFDLDQELTPRQVAGVPPDGFSPTGQLWGNPLYDWPRHAADGYAWWASRLRHQMGLVDIVRLDHFRGLESYFAIPQGESDAHNGVWRPGPGLDFFQAIREQLGEVPMIAEDLGYLTQDVTDLRDRAGLPGMQLLQFAFDSRESSDYWPHNFSRDTVVYTGTHDNDTLLGWFDSLSAADQERAHRYLHNWWTPRDELVWDFITAAQRSVARTCIIPMADYLGLGSQARINTPSRSGGCWRWRMSEQAFTKELIARMAALTTLVERC